MGNVSLDIPAAQQLFMMFHLLSLQHFVPKWVPWEYHHNRFSLKLGGDKVATELTQPKDTANGAEDKGALSFSPHTFTPKKMWPQAGWDKQVFSNGKVQRFWRIPLFLGLSSATQPHQQNKHLCKPWNQSMLILLSQDVPAPLDHFCLAGESWFSNCIARSIWWF